VPSFVTGKTGIVDNLKLCLFASPSRNDPLNFLAFQSLFFIGLEMNEMSDGIEMK
jgi:hypothetical protein